MFNRNRLKRFSEKNVTEKDNDNNSGERNQAITVRSFVETEYLDNRRTETKQ